MLVPGHLVRCPCFWPREPEHLTQLGYLIPGPADVLRVLYVGTAGTGDQGWLYCRLVSDVPTEGCSAPARSPPHGWIPCWAVLRLRAPGPIWRVAWDGRRYPLAAWLRHYGEDVGLRFWERAPH